MSLTRILIALSAAGSALAIPLYNNSSVAAQSQSFTGDITYYQPGLGACGETNSDSDAVVAMSPEQYTGNCGKSITITKDGKTATAKVVDKCPACASGSIDVSSTVFESLVDLSVGRTTMDVPDRRAALARKKMQLPGRRAGHDANG
ncbi:RlpA-like double-psi beta-barrel-protein domain-containing protein-containing protein [Xylaria castorea]|nr:RlpA-like double-psi beta-barrel-protein domain-containing protein-containing protein [Xylaria castorea]